MVAVDVLLALNLLVLGACALRGRLDRRRQAQSVYAYGSGQWNGILSEMLGRRGSRGEVPGQLQPDAVILPFRSRTSTDLEQAVSMHPSAQRRSGAEPPR